MKKAVIVIGLGNTLMSDEGVGVRVVQRLLDFAGLRRAQSSRRFPLVDFIDAGTGGMSILHFIRGKDKAIFIDCARMGEKPGVIRKFTPQEIKSTRVLAHQSLHEADLIKVIDLAGQLGQCPAQIVIFGIEPELVELGAELSKTLAGKLEHYVSVVCRELENRMAAEGV
jgi:hydrogenase maturation protease